MGLEQGLIQVYTGEGKGKTTAALGLALRAAGHGLQVHIVQFLKGRPDRGERKALQHQPNITLVAFGRPRFVNCDNPDPEDVRLAQEAVRHCLDILSGQRYDVVILDEINVALRCGVISLDQVLALLDAKPPHVELVLTGRDAHPTIIERAHLVTEMRAIKHPYEHGVASRQGIEY
jgi:cob(I)alamin adenosyltransferase